MIETELGGHGRSKNPNPRRMKRGVLKKKEQRERGAKMGVEVKKVVLGMKIELTAMEIVWKFNVR